jgi:hypothetical protein
MTNLTPGVRSVMQCETSTGESCSSSGAGHTILALQERVTAATPSKWRDALVRSVSANGWIELGVVDTAETVWVWNHTDRTHILPAGTPVSLHGLYHALAIGRERVNVLVAASLDEL